MNEAEVRQFWQANPCGDNLLSRTDYAALEEFFNEYDRFKYDLEPHIPECLDQIGLNGQRVLEVGLGQGAESEQIVRRGGIWTGLDLTDEAVARVQARLNMRGLKFDNVVRGSITNAPFEDNSFDLVFSHGVLHHVPDIHAAQKEIHRVLKPGGRLVVMLYAKYSLNYLVAIAAVRRLGLLAMAATGVKGDGVYAQHMANAKKMGVFNYLKLSNFIHTNTDGPLNPYSKVYSRKLVEEDFTDFRIERTYKRFMHAPPLPVRWMPFEDLLGWHLWVEMVAK